MPRVLTKNWLRLLLIFFTAFGVTLIVATIAKCYTQDAKTGEGNNETGNVSEEVVSVTLTEPEVKKPAFIDLQPVVDQWAANLRAEAGIEIYDLDNNTVAATHNADETFGLASIYKLFFVYDGYRQISSGLADPNEVITTSDPKGMLNYTACLDLMVRESYNGCAEPIRENTEKSARVEALISDLGLGSVSNLGMYGNARDVTEFMKVLWQHEGFNEESWAQLLDSMLDQPKTTYNWRQGLPSGFKSAAVYNKVGWNYDGARWTIYDDTAFVVFPELDRHYIITALTSGLLTHQPLVTLGEAIESAVLGYGVTE